MRLSCGPFRRAKGARHAKLQELGQAQAREVNAFKPPAPLGFVTWLTSAWRLFQLIAALGKTDSPSPRDTESPPDEAASESTQTQIESDDL
jgi:hypothetical protein